MGDVAGLGPIMRNPREKPRVAQSLDAEASRGESAFPPCDQTSPGFAWKQVRPLRSAGTFLAAHALHDRNNFARTRIDNGDKFFDRKVAVPFQLGRYALGFSRQFLKRYIGWNDSVSLQCKINVIDRLGSSVGDDLADLVLLIERERRR
ncbi:MAG TPA: hypothetical protein VIJ78_01790 [Pseudolabrys sp.]